MARRKTRLAKFKKKVSRTIRWFALIPARCRFWWNEYWNEQYYMVMDYVPNKIDDRVTMYWWGSSFSEALSVAKKCQSNKNGTYYIVFEDGPYDNEVAFTLTKIVRK